MRFREDLYDRDDGYSHVSQYGFFQETVDTFAHSIYLQLSLVFAAFCIGRCWWDLNRLGNTGHKSERESIWFHLFLGLALSVIWPLPALAYLINYWEAWREKRQGG